MQNIIVDVRNMLIISNCRNCFNPTRGWLWRLVSYLITYTWCILLRVSSYGALVEYGCEKKVTQFSNLSVSLAVGVPSGVTLKLR